LAGEQDIGDGAVILIKNFRISAEHPKPYLKNSGRGSDAEWPPNAKIDLFFICENLTICRQAKK
jgi:hypothetical protein